MKVIIVTVLYSFSFPLPFSIAFRLVVYRDIEYTVQCYKDVDS